VDSLDRAGTSTCVGQSFGSRNRSIGAGALKEDEMRRKVKLLKKQHEDALPENTMVFECLPEGILNQVILFTTPSGAGSIDDRECERPFRDVLDCDR
jgi:hypothetical protein